MIAALLLATAQPMTALDAERAFAADAQKIGQWTAFAKWSADDAVMFVPQPVNAHSFLKDRKNPPVAVFWWPGRSYASCDGAYAVNTGPWVREWGKAVGYFTTVWKRQPDGSWKWIYDGGDALGTLRPEGGDVRQVTAACGGSMPSSAADAPPTEGAASGSGASPDGTLRWSWIVMPDGARAFRAFLWNGGEYDQVVTDSIAATPK
jgi:ketosteroid isomerase-like protein